MTERKFFQTSLGEDVYLDVDGKLLHIPGDEVEQAQQKILSSGDRAVQVIPAKVKKQDFFTGQKFEQMVRVPIHEYEDFSAESAKRGVSIEYPYPSEMAFTPDLYIKDLEKRRKYAEKREIDWRKNPMALYDVEPPNTFVRDAVNAVKARVTDAAKNPLGNLARNMVPVFGPALDMAMRSGQGGSPEQAEPPPSQQVEMIEKNPKGEPYIQQGTGTPAPKSASMVQKRLSDADKRDMKRVESLLMEGGDTGMMVPESLGVPQSEPPGGLLFDAVPKKYTRTTGEFTKDLAIDTGSGLLTGVRIMSDAFGADNPVSGFIREKQEVLADLLSAGAKEDKERVQAILKEAEDGGFKDQLIAGLKAFAEAPVSMSAQAVGTAVPTLLGGYASAALRLGTVATGAVLSGIGAAQGMGAAKSQIYDGVKAYLMEHGYAGEDAERVAAEAQSYGGDNLDQILIAGGLGVLAARTGAEKILGRIASKQTGKIAGGVATRALAGGVAEAVPEGFQGGQEQLAENIALRRLGADVPVGRGVVSQGTLEAASAAGMGAGLGAIERSAPRGSEKDAQRLGQKIWEQSAQDAEKQREILRITDDPNRSDEEKAELSFDVLRETFEESVAKDIDVPVSTIDSMNANIVAGKELTEDEAKLRKAIEDELGVHGEDAIGPDGMPVWIGSRINSPGEITYNKLENQWIIRLRDGQADVNTVREEYAEYRIRKMIYSDPETQGEILDNMKRYRGWLNSRMDSLGKGRKADVERKTIQDMLAKMDRQVAFAQQAAMGDPDAQVNGEKAMVEFVSDLSVQMQAKEEAGGMEKAFTEKFVAFMRRFITSAQRKVRSILRQAQLLDRAIDQGVMTDEMVRALGQTYIGSQLTPASAAQQDAQQEVFSTPGATIVRPRPQAEPMLQEDLPTPEASGATAADSQGTPDTPNAKASPRGEAPRIEQADTQRPQEDGAQTPDQSNTTFSPAPLDPNERRKGDVTRRREVSQELEDERTDRMLPDMVSFAEGYSKKNADYLNSLGVNPSQVEEAAILGMTKTLGVKAETEEQWDKYARASSRNEINRVISEAKKRRQTDRSTNVPLDGEGGATFEDSMTADTEALPTSKQLEGKIKEMDGNTREQASDRLVESIKRVADEHAKGVTGQAKKIAKAYATEARRVAQGLRDRGGKDPASGINAYIAKKLGVSPARVSQVVNQVKAKLRKDPDFLKAASDMREALTTRSLDIAPRVKTAEDYEQEIPDNAPPPEKMKQERGASAVVRMLDVISSRLAKIHPNLKIAMRNYEQNQRLTLAKWEKQVDPLIRQLDRLKKTSQKRYQRVAKAMMEGQYDAAVGLMRKYGIDPKAYDQAIEMFEEVHSTLSDLGLQMGKLENYFPRRVADLRGLKKKLEEKYGVPANEIERALLDEQTKKSAPLTAYEESEVISRVVFRYRNPSQAFAHRNKRMMPTIDPDLLPFYADPVETATKYLENAAEIAARNVALQKLSGQFKALTDERVNLIEEYENETDPQRQNELSDRINQLGVILGGLDTALYDPHNSTVGIVMQDLIRKGEITTEQATEAGKLMRARFDYRPQSKGWQVLKSTAYMTTLGQYKAALRNLADLVPTIIDVGVADGIKSGVLPSLFKNLSGKGVKVGDSYITMDDVLGEIKLNEEFVETDAANRGMKAAFKYSLFNWSDRVGKESLANARVAKLRKLAEKARGGDENALKQVEKMLEEVFTIDELNEPSLIDELASKTKNDAQLRVAFNALSDYMPVSKIEMPENYLKGGLHQLPYMYRSYLVKFWDYTRRRSLSEAAAGFKSKDAGRVVKGLAEFGRISAYFLSTNYLATMLIAALLNRDEDEKEVWLNEIANMFGWSRYQSFMLTQKGGAKQIALSFFAPPVAQVLDLADDVADYMDKGDDWTGPRATRMVPLVGSMLYYGMPFRDTLMRKAGIDRGALKLLSDDMALLDPMASNLEKNARLKEMGMPRLFGRGDIMERTYPPAVSALMQDADDNDTTIQNRSRYGNVAKRRQQMKKYMDNPDAFYDLAEILADEAELRRDMLR